MSAERTLTGTSSIKWIKLVYIFFTAVLTLENAVMIWAEADFNRFLIFSISFCAIISVGLFWASGYFHMNPTSKLETSVCCSIVRMAHFMPFTKEDYIKAGIIKWAEAQLIFSLSQTVLIIYTMFLGNTMVAGFIGTDYFFVNIMQIVIGVLAMLPNVIGLKTFKGNFWLTITGVTGVAFMIILLLAEPVFSRTYTFVGYCSVLGIIGGFMVIPIVAAVTLFIMQVTDKRAWFRS